MPSLLRRLALPAALALSVLVAAPAGAVAKPRVSVLKVALTDPAVEVPALQRLGVDVTENVRPEFAEVITYNAAERKLLRAHGFSWSVEHADFAKTLRADRRADQRYAARVAPSPLPSGKDQYRVYGDYVAEMDKLAAQNPSLVRRITLPKKTVMGQPITGVEISNQVSRTDDGKPVYVVMGAHHAREWPSAEVNLEFALDLVKNYGTNPRITRLLDNERVFVIPIVNVDGFIVSRGNLTAGDPLYDEVYPANNGSNKRKNCAANTPLEAGKPCEQRSGVDLNRNYGAYWGGNGASSYYAADDYRGPGPFSEPEAQAVHEFSQRLQITNFQTIHNIAALVLRPPGFRAQGLAPDEERLKILGDAMGAATGYSSEYGFQLYEVTGATEDWNYDAQGAFGYTIELGGRSGFQGPFKDNVVDQYLGSGARRGKGVREALLLAAEQAMNPVDHAVLSGTAGPGNLLRLRKDFKTSTSPVCPVDVGIFDSISGQLSPDGTYISSCPVGLQKMELDDFLDTTMTVPESGTYTWHVNPSTRPFVKKAGGVEQWTLTCETPTGQVLDTEKVTVDRGEQRRVDLDCGAPSLQ